MYNVFFFGFILAYKIPTAFAKASVYDTDLPVLKDFGVAKA